MKKYLLIALFIGQIPFLFISCRSKPPSAQGNVKVSSNEKVEADVLYYVNQHRRSKGLSPLQLNKVISDEAEKHSQRMARGQTSLGHSGFSTRVQRISDQLGHISQSAENVAYGSRTGEEVVSNWLKSPGHRQNIEGDFNLTGIGLARNNKGIIYFTQLFIRRDGRP